MTTAASYRILTDGEPATEAVGAALSPLLAPDDVLLLSGDLGAGKTHLSKGVAAGLGIADPVTSPTFNILLVHRGGRLVLYHLDLYRLEHAEELDEIGYWEALESGGVSLVEWGDRFPEAAPVQYVAVELHITGDDDRTLAVSGVGVRGGVLAAAWAAASLGLPGVRVEGGPE